MPPVGDSSEFTPFSRADFFADMRISGSSIIIFSAHILSGSSFVISLHEVMPSIIIGRLYGNFIKVFSPYIDSGASILNISRIFAITVFVAIQRARRACISDVSSFLT